MGEQVCMVCRPVGKPARQQITQNVVLGEEDIIEGYRPGIGATPSKLFFIGLGPKTFVLALDDRAAIPLIAVAVA